MTCISFQDCSVSQVWYLCLVFLVWLLVYE